jgi:hypothetical protein
MFGQKFSSPVLLVIYFRVFVLTGEVVPGLSLYKNDNTMLKKIIVIVVFVYSAIILQSFKTFKVMKKDGAAPGYTGSPGDSLKDCTACHGGFAVKIPGWITSDIPFQGYIPGVTYNITASNKEFGATRYGFEVSPQDTLGNLLGTMIITDAVRTKLVGSDKYITYTAQGVEGIDSLSWSFKWVAPPKGTGNVVFYGGFNSNFDGHKGGDKTTLSTLTVKESNWPVGTNMYVDRTKGMRVFPNPSDNSLTVCFEVKKESEILLEVIDLSGKQCAVLMRETAKGEIRKQFNTSTLATGNYLLRLHSEGSTETQSITIEH